ncbi:MAG TPA: class I SAM-dependent methyltransferase [Candidatus Binatia bacterium]|nr:class I SAM-dependent methyltransferase [Candidatus Binatia bacterium]
MIVLTLFPNRWSLNARWRRMTATLLLAMGGLGFDSGDPASIAHAEKHGRGSTYIAPFVPTPQEVIDRMLELAQVSQDDLLYDLGSGDGRIVITAAKRYGAKAVGFEIDDTLVKESQRSIKEAGVEALAEIRQEDVRTVDLSPASVVTMYLSSGANLRLRAAIQSQLKPGSRVVSHDFNMGDWQPDQVERMIDSAGLPRTIYLWRIGDLTAR